MKYRVKNTLRAMAREIGLTVVFVTYFGDDVHGRLLPREKRILINAHKPRTEHVFTMLHEIGHYLIHFKNPHRKHHPWIFDLQCKIGWLASLCSKVRRHYRFIFAREAGREWEADLWAFCAFIVLAKRIGCFDYLARFLDQHPEKLKTFSLAALGVAYGGAKSWCQKTVTTLGLPFRSCVPGR